MFLPRLRIPLSSLAALALGAGLTAIWFLAPDTADPEKLRAAEAGTDPQVTAATASETSGQTAPWKTKSVAKDAEPTAQKPPVEEFADMESVRRSMRAQLRYQARNEALELTYRLELDPKQAEGLLASTLTEAENRLQELAPKEPWATNVPWIAPTAAWLAANLTPEQKKASPL
ncbi:MAG: hypothetical protein ACKO2G_14650 [Verrucomicrobiales bacterium]